MKLFNKPKWLRPEINETKYWTHILILVAVTLGILKYVFDHDMFAYGMFLKVALAVVIADVTAHSVLGFD